MQYSPKLKKVMEQIKQVMRENDVAGFCVIHSPGFSEFLTEITPSYSCAEWTPRQDGILIKGKLEPHNGNRKIRDKKLNDTVNMFVHLSDVMGRNTMNMIQVTESAEKTWDVVKSEGNKTGHNEQNN